MTDEVNYALSPMYYRLVAIVGPTASGKTALAIELAQKINGEIICADSRTVYKGMDIGTAKPTKQEQKAVKHHLLDVVDPSHNFTVADFKRLANKAIQDIQSRGKLPILVGGSGLYVDSVLYDFGFADNTERDPVNPRHSAKSSPKTRKQLMEGAVVVGLNPGREIIRSKIADRVEKMLEQGFLDEVSSLLQKYIGAKSMQAPGYKAFAEYLNGNLTLEEAKQLFITNDRQLAKRQMAWFKRNQDIHWFTDAGSALAFLTKSSIDNISNGQKATTTKDA